MHSNNPIEIDAFNIPSWVSVKLNHKKLSEFVVVDVGANSFNSKDGSILSIAAVRFINGAPAAHFYTVSKPTEKTEEGTYNRRFAFTVNMLDEATIEIAPDEKDVMAAFGKFVGSSPVVGHNVARFDARLIGKAFRKHKIQSSFDSIIYDTYEIAKNLNIFQNSSLAGVCKELKIRQIDPHHALSDCIATGEVMLYFLENHYNEAVKKNFFMSYCTLLHGNIDKSPIVSKPINDYYVADIGLSDKLNRLAIAQTIVDNGGFYLHNILKETTVVLYGNILLEDEAISRYTKFGSASAKLARTNKLIRKAKKIELFDLNEFIIEIAEDHCAQLSNLEIDLKLSADQVSSPIGDLSIMEVWENWNKHVSIYSRKSQPYTPIPIAREKNTVVGSFNNETSRSDSTKELLESLRSRFLNKEVSEIDEPIAPRRIVTYPDWAFIGATAYVRSKDGIHSKAIITKVLNTQIVVDCLKYNGTKNYQERFLVMEFPKNSPYRVGQTSLDPELRTTLVSQHEGEAALASMPSNESLISQRMDVENIAKKLRAVMSADLKVSGVDAIISAFQLIRTEIDEADSRSDLEQRP